MAEVEAIGKDRKNTQQGFAFRGIEDIYNELHPLLVKYKLFTVPNVIDVKREQRETGKGGTLMYSIVTVEYTAVCAVDGSSHRLGLIVGEGMDSGDKATNKALSVAHKYAWIQALNIPTKDLSDSDADSPPPSRPREERRTVQPHPDDVPPADQPRKSYEQIRKELGESLREWTKGDKAEARAIVNFIYPGLASVSVLSESQVRPYALGWWIYRLLAGNEKRLLSWMEENKLPWFDKLSVPQMDQLKKFCEYEDNKQKNRADGVNTHAPKTQDADGNDPF